MSGTVLYAFTGAGLAAMGVYGLIAGRHLLRRILSFNVVGGGIFLMFGALGGGAASDAADPVPQAMIITGIVVALSATALAVALAVRLHGETTARPSDTGDGDG